MQLRHEPVGMKHDYLTTLFWPVFSDFAGDGASPAGAVPVPEWVRDLELQVPLPLGNPTT